MNQILKLYTWDEWPIDGIASVLEIPEEEVKMHLRAHGIEIKEKRKHNYPKTRKKAIYKNTQKYELLQSHPESYIKEIWVKYGMYEGGEILDCNAKVLWHLAREKGWQRPLPDFLVLAVETGNWKMSENYYIEKEGSEQ